MEKNDITYLILQELYLKAQGYENAPEEEILKNQDKIFPVDWFLKYPVEVRIDLMTEAIKGKKSLSEVVKEAGLAK